MTPIEECPHEHEVVEAIIDGRWPHASEAALVAHAAACMICGEVIAVASAMRADFEHARAAVNVPPAGLVWWRAQLRARRQMAETATRPITCVHALTGAVGAGLFFALGGLLWPWLRASIQWIASASRLADVGALWVPLALAVGGWLVVAPLLLLLVLSAE
jgi:hypothetical protein